jgi:hypothetical protein
VIGCASTAFPIKGGKLVHPLLSSLVSAQRTNCGLCSSKPGYIAVEPKLRHKIRRTGRA